MPKGEFLVPSAKPFHDIRNMYVFFLIRQPQNVPYEVWVVLIVVTFGIIFELYDVENVLNGETLPHVTMYAFFAFYPIMELLYYFKLDHVPPKLDYIGLIMAFSVEGFMFHEHLHGRTPLNQQLHTYLFYATMSCALATTLEMFWIYDVRPALARAVCTLVQGTWLLQVSCIVRSFWI